MQGRTKHMVAVATAQSAVVMIQMYINVMRNICPFSNSGGPFMPTNPLHRISSQLGREIPIDALTDT